MNFNDREGKEWFCSTCIHGPEVCQDRFPDFSCHEEKEMDEKIADQVKTYKTKLEKEITNLIIKFEDETGFFVYSIDVDSHPNFEDGKRLPSPVRVSLRGL